MAPKNYRLRLTNDIKNVIKNGRLIRGHIFSFKFIKNNLPHFRFTVIVSAKISKQAIQRNKLKRRVRDCVMQSAQKISPIDFILIAQKNSTKENFVEIKKEISFLLSKIKNS